MGGRATRQLLSGDGGIGDCLLRRQEVNMKGWKWGGAIRVKRGFKIELRSCWLDNEQGCSITACSTAKPFLC